MPVACVAPVAGSVARVASVVPAAVLLEEEDEELEELEELDDPPAATAPPPTVCATGPDDPVPVAVALAVGVPAAGVCVKSDESTVAPSEVSMTSVTGGE